MGIEERAKELFYEGAALIARGNQAEGIENLESHLGALTEDVAFVARLQIIKACEELGPSYSEKARFYANQLLAKDPDLPSIQKYRIS